MSVEDWGGDEGTGVRECQVELFSVFALFFLILIVRGSRVDEAIIIGLGPNFWLSSVNDYCHYYVKVFHEHTFGKTTLSYTKTEVYLLSYFSESLMC